MVAVNFIVRGPKYRTARQLVGDGTFPVPQSTLLRHARAHGIGRKAGRNILFSENDVTAVYEAFPCSNSSGDPKAPTGSCVALSGDKALKKVLALLTEKSPKKSGQNAKTKS